MLRICIEVLIFQRFECMFGYGNLEELSFDQSREALLKAQLRITALHKYELFSARYTDDMYKHALFFYVPLDVKKVGCAASSTNGCLPSACLSTCIYAPANLSCLHPTLTPKTSS